MARAAAGHTVLFLEEPVYADGGELPRLQMFRQPGGVTVLVPTLPHGLAEEEQVRLQRRLLDSVLDPYLSARLTLWYYTPMALRFSSHLRPELCVYDCMDELSAFRFAPAGLLELEQSLLERADLVFTGGRSLYQAKRARHHDCHQFPSSVEYGHFARARGSEIHEPPDQARLPRPLIGFAGVIDERMDMSLLAQLAQGRPDLHFVCIGPVVKIDPASLPQRANIHWMGPRGYEDLPAYLSGWDAAFMPFALNESTRFISPTKTPEFLAAGLPVCSTAIADVVTPYGKLGLVQIAADAEAFATGIDLARECADQRWLSRVDDYLKTMSWDDTWSRMAVLMRRARRKRVAACSVTVREESRAHG
jgi:UDP-galactopyranose mutase